MYSSSIQNVSLGFSELDIAAAQVVVKRLVANQWRKGPSDLLVVEPSALIQWWREDAIAWLREQKAERQGRVVAEIP
jgi:hypothetical protein